MVTGRFMSYVPTMVAVTISLPAQMQKNMPNYVLPMLRICDNTFTNGMCYFHVLVNSAASGQYGPYGIYRNQYYRMTLNSIQAPGNPNDNFDHNQVISPNTWVDVNITVDEWQEIDEDCDL